MLLPMYLSKTKAIIEKYGWPTTGLLEYKLGVHQVYAEFLLDQLNPLGHLWNGDGKSLAEKAQDMYTKAHEMKTSSERCIQNV